MTRVNGVMRREPGVPAEWVCNARTAHRDGVDQCFCCQCLIDTDPSLATGEPQPTERNSAEYLAEKGLVGMYRRKAEFYMPCHECGVSIPITDATHVAAIRSGESVLYHYECFPATLEVVVPYVLDLVSPTEAQDAEGSTPVCREDGSPAEGERLEGGLEGEESRDADE